MCDKDWRYVLRCEPQTHRLSLNFYECRSCTIQQDGGNIEKEKLEYILLAKLAYMQSWLAEVVIFHSRVYVKMHVQVNFTVVLPPYCYRGIFSCCGENGVS